MLRASGGHGTRSSAFYAANPNLGWEENAELLAGAFADPERGPDGWAFTLVPERYVFGAANHVGKDRA